MPDSKLVALASIDKDDRHRREEHMGKMLEKALTGSHFSIDFTGNISLGPGKFATMHSCRIFFNLCSKEGPGMCCKFILAYTNYFLPAFETFCFRCSAQGVPLLAHGAYHGTA